MRPENCVHHSYSMVVFRKAYTPFINPIPGQEYWASTNAKTIHPLIYGTPAGRPKKKRIQEKGEPSNPCKLGRKYGKTKCSRCHQVGHNSRGCKNPIMESGMESCKGSRKRNYEVQSSQVVLDPPPQSQSSQVQ